MTEKNRGGRPPHEPTDILRAQVKMMAAFGNTEEQISAIIGISKPTLRRHYKRELSLGQQEATNAVAMNLFKQATKNDPKSIRAAEFWLRCRGWNDKPQSADGREEPLGKKAAADAEARAVGAAGGTFAPPPPPRLIVNNKK